MLSKVSTLLFHAWRLLPAAFAFGAFPFGQLRAADQLPGYAVVPITLQDGSNQAVARVTINDQATLLILDTGATSTVLDSKFYGFVNAKAGGNSESKLPPELQHKTISANGQKVKLGYVDTMKVGSTNLGGGPVVVADFSGLFGRYNASHPTGQIAGLLGEDILRKYSAIIDWRRRGVYFNTDPSKRLKLGPGLTGAGWSAIPMTTTGARHFAVACTVEDKPVRLVVDTGAEFTTFDRAAITLRHPLYNHGRSNSIGHLAINEMRSSMFGMDSTGYLAKIENWKVGNYPIPHSIVMTNRAPNELATHDHGGEGPIVGLLGAEVLASNNAIVDVAGSTLYLKPSPTAKH